MKKNKRAEVFSLWLVLLTIVFSGLALLNSIHSYEKINAGMVSPVQILEQGDDYKLFESLEENMVLEAYNVAKNKENSREVFRQEFFKEFNSEPFMREFLQENLVIQRKQKYLEGEEYNAFITNFLYPEDKTIFEGKELIFSRVKVSKEIDLSNAKQGDLKFPTTLVFEFEKTYHIK